MSVWVSENVRKVVEFVIGYHDMSLKREKFPTFPVDATKFYLEGESSVRGRYIDNKRYVLGLSFFGHNEYLPGLQLGRQEKIFHRDGREDSGWSIVAMVLKPLLFLSRENANFGYEQWLVKTAERGVRVATYTDHKVSGDRYPGISNNPELGFFVLLLDLASIAGFWNNARDREHLTVRPQGVTIDEARRWTR